jgi:hypothetical protein
MHLCHAEPLGISTLTGAHYFDQRDTALTLQTMWFHLSKAGMKLPNNGTNTLLLSVGVQAVRLTTASLL